MSKIYEALLRAEMERITDVNRSGDAADAEKSWFPKEVDDRRASVDPEIKNRSSISATEPLADHTPEPYPASLEMEYVPEASTPPVFTPRIVEWNPDEKRLQSLQSRGVLVEQIRGLRSRLHELRLDRPLKTVLISSGLPEEGKSFVAANLAVGFAKFKNRRVLLIDGDMRRGTLHNLLGAPQEPGLTDYLAGRATPQEVMQRMKLPESGPLRSLASLTFIANGQDTDNAADLSGNERFETLLRSVYDSFDWIIVDSSPVTLVADGVNLARVCDGVVLVARGGVTKYEVAQRAQQELKAAHIVGVVLNAVEGAPQTGGYYGYDS